MFTGVWALVLLVGIRSVNFENESTTVIKYWFLFLLWGRVPIWSIEWQFRGLVAYKSVLGLLRPLTLHASLNLLVNLVLEIPSPEVLSYVCEDFGDIHLG